MKVYTKLLAILTVVCFTVMAWSYDIDLPKKWSQPPEAIPAGAPFNLYLGWDQPSMEGQVLVADDWLCRGPLPVTGIHWWGSYPDWIEPVAPYSPDAFIIRFYTNVPADPDQPGSFSYPGELLHTIRCEIYEEEFVGYDVNPWDSTIRDATFQYTQIFKEDEWFWQDPAIDKIFWVSIAALYLPPAPTDITWGWKTRPWYFEDDAVEMGVILPYMRPIQGPDGASWDMAFELYTIPEPGSMILIGVGLLGLMRRKK